MGIKGQNYELSNKYYCLLKKCGKEFVNTGIRCELDLKNNNQYQYTVNEGCLFPGKSTDYKGNYEIRGNTIILYKENKILMKLKIKQEYLQEKKFLGFIKKKKIFRPIED
jgi:hypothetical protein